MNRDTSHTRFASRIAASASSSKNPVTLPTLGGEEWLGSWADVYMTARDFASSLHTSACMIVDRLRNPSRAQAADGRQLTVGVMGDTSKDLVVAIEAVWLGGDTLVPLPLPYRADDLEGFVDDTRQRVKLSEMDVLLVDDMVAAMLEGTDLGVPVVTFAGVAASPRLQPVAWRPGDLAVLQFTSGSTSAPKAVEVSYGMLDWHISALWERVEPEGDDVLVSWLPLYHDMGLVGALCYPMVTGTGLALSGPLSFATNPRSWMRNISKHRGAITVGPNFAYALAAKFLKSEDDLDLSCVRIAINGAEPVAVEALEAWTDAGARFGLNPGAVFCAYGMAEAVLAITFPPVGRGIVTDVSPDGATLVVLGTDMGGVVHRVTDPVTGETLGARTIGELELSGPAVTAGYHRHDDTGVFRDGWLRTGDLGYSTENNEVVVCGRIKDMIVFGGRNIYPQDIEKVASEMPGVRVGNVAAFGVTVFDGDVGTERVVVFAESKLDDTSSLAKTVSAHVLAETGIRPTVKIVGPGSIPKTSSGKLRRSACKERWLAETVQSP